MNKTTLELLELVRQIHVGFFELVKQSIGRYLTVAGNIAIFCQSDNDFEHFSGAAEQLTEPSDNPNQKYFRLTKRTDYTSSN